MRLPLTIQAHLTGTELTDLKELAQLADRLWQCNPSQPVAAVTAELQSDEESEVVVAMPAKKRPTNKHYKSQQHKPTSNKTGKVKFICFKHNKYGEDASTVQTGRTAPGQETRQPGNGGRCFLWPNRPTSLAGGRVNTAAVPGRHGQFLLHHPSPVTGADIRSSPVYS